MTYNAGRIQLTKGSGVTSTLTATALTRGTNGMLSIISSNLSTDLGTSENFISTVLLPTSNGMLNAPSIVGRNATTGSLNFLRHPALPPASSSTTPRPRGPSEPPQPPRLPTSPGGAQAVANGTIDVLGPAHGCAISAGGGSSLLRLANGGLIMNGTTAPSRSSSDLRFGTAATAQEGSVWVRGGQTGDSSNLREL